MSTTQSDKYLFPIPFAIVTSIFIQGVAITILGIVFLQGVAITILGVVFLQGVAITIPGVSLFNSYPGFLEAGKGWIFLGE